MVLDTLKRQRHTLPERSTVCGQTVCAPGRNSQLRDQNSLNVMEMDLSQSHSLFNVVESLCEKAEINFTECVPRFTKSRSRTETGTVKEQQPIETQASQHSVLQTEVQFCSNILKAAVKFTNKEIFLKKLNLWWICRFCKNLLTKKIFTFLVVNDTVPHNKYY